MEYADKMMHVFNTSLAFGVIVPFLTVLFGTLGGVIDFDLDMDADTGFEGIIPLNLMCLSFSAVVYGALGRLIVGTLIKEKGEISVKMVAVILLGLTVISVVAYNAIYKFIVVKLQSNKPLVLNAEKIVGKEGTVILRIKSDSDGIISLADSTGASISYKARLAENSKIQGDYVIHQGAKVSVVKYDESEKVCYIEIL